MLLQESLPSAMPGGGYAHRAMQAMVQKPAMAAVWKILMDRGGHEKVSALGRHLEDARISTGCGYLEENNLPWHLHSWF